MAMIHFTEEDKRLGSLGEFGLAHPGEIIVHIEDAEACEGLKCAERLEAALTTEQYATWLEFHSERPPVGKHSHLVARGLRPDTRPSITAVFPKGRTECT